MIFVDSTNEDEYNVEVAITYNEWQVKWKFGLSWGGIGGQIGS